MNKVLALALLGFLVWAWTSTVGPGFWNGIVQEAQTEVLIVAETAMKLSAKIYAFITSGA